ncbi:DUF2637 domain-containing protein [Streptomyces sp. TRM 70361]|uniref:DUF2637 domain-containing protein n=1 Tax=Streptomyces sp. TRM 70361 TaxID=3116553 RepID=UPI002E7ACDE2|nr:DUF2637 domain-containing protein [Streptomyces sp. TRM 70361]MEE1940257.1 DUF2637 domain-containing protein [Streptomyces sp. TRM 70361]
MREQDQYFEPYGVPAPGDPGGRRTAAPPGFGAVPEQRAPAPPESDLLGPAWDFEAELAQLLRDPGRLPPSPPPRSRNRHQRPRDTAPAAPGGGPGDGPGGKDEATWVLRRFEATAETVPHDEVSGVPPEYPREARSPVVRRRRRRRTHRPEVSWLHMFSFAVAALTACVVAMISVLGGLVSYDPLRRLAGPHVLGELARWWPLLVYGPWLAASLSILRATVLRRRARHSWAVVVLFSTVAVVLCVAHAPRTLSGIAAAGLPPVTALVCFHQLVGQITLTQPRHALPRRSVPLPRQRGPVGRHTAHRDGDRG